MQKQYNLLTKIPWSWDKTQGLQKYFDLVYLPVYQKFTDEEVFVLVDSMYFRKRVISPHITFLNAEYLAIYYDSQCIEYHIQRTAYPYLVDSCKVYLYHLPTQKLQTLVLHPAEEQLEYQYLKIQGDLESNRIYIKGWVAERVEYTYVSGAVFGARGGGLLYRKNPPVAPTFWVHTFDGEGKLLQKEMHTGMEKEFSVLEEMTALEYRANFPKTTMGYSKKNSMPLSSRQGIRFQEELSTIIISPSAQYLYQMLPISVEMPHLIKIEKYLLGGVKEKVLQFDLTPCVEKIEKFETLRNEGNPNVNEPFYFWYLGYVDTQERFYFFAMEEAIRFVFIFDRDGNLLPSEKNGRAIEVPSKPEKKYPEETRGNSPAYDQAFRAWRENALHKLEDLKDDQEKVESWAAPARQWLYQEENQKLYIPVMGADELFIVEVEYTFPPKA